MPQANRGWQYVSAPYIHVRQAAKPSSKARALLCSMKEFRKKAELLDDPDLGMDVHIPPTIKWTIDSATTIVEDLITVNS